MPLIVGQSSSLPTSRAGRLAVTARPRAAIFLQLKLGEPPRLLGASSLKLPLLRVALKMGAYPLPGSEGRRLCLARVSRQVDFDKAGLIAAPVVKN